MIFTGSHQVLCNEQELPDSNSDREPDNPELAQLPQLCEGGTEGLHYGRQVAPAELLRHAGIRSAHPAVSFSARGYVKTDHSHSAGQPVMAPPLRAILVRTVRPVNL